MHKKLKIALFHLHIIIFMHLMLLNYIKMNENLCVHKLFDI